MNALPSKHQFAVQYTLAGRAITLRPPASADRDTLIRFAQSLPPDDLLFLDRDITEEAEVDWWLNHSASTLATILASESGAILGYSTVQPGLVRWTRHVAELRVVVGPGARGIGLGRLLLEFAFERALADGIRKVVARMPPSQTAAVALFKSLGFEQEALLRDHAVGADGTTHDLLVYTFRARLHPEQKCRGCGVPVLNALALDGAVFCSQCYELRYRELGGGA
jgi:L-amino acid N-acyltransferase YncA